MQQHIGGLVIGQTFQDEQQGAPLRIVAIDPELHSVEAEGPGGDVVSDTIEHFTATHLLLAG
jgi:hypothetical protein